MKRLTREWLDKAEDDFNVASSLSRSRKARVPDAICFHASNVPKSCSKLVYVRMGSPFPKRTTL